MCRIGVKKKQDITIHHLLTHTAGIKDTVGDDYLFETTEEVLNRINYQPLLSKSGTKYHYANDGFTLLTMVLEKVTGKEYEEYLNQHIFAPLGMKETGYNLPKWNSSKISHGYVNFHNFGHSLEKCYPTWALKGTGGMLSTLEDMFRWHKALVDYEILDKKTTELMYIPYLNNYGCGWEVDESNGQLIVSHNGASYYGTSACFYRNLITEQTIILFTNQSFNHFALVKPIMHHVKEILELESLGSDGIVKKMSNIPNLSLEHLPKTLKGKTIKYSLNGTSAKINWGSHFGLLELSDDVLRFLVNKQVNENIDNSIAIAHELVEQSDTILRLMLNNPEIIEQRKTILGRTIQEYVEKNGEINRIAVYGASPSVIMKSTVEIRVELKNTVTESDALYMYFFWEEEGKLKYVGFANGLKDVETLLIKPMKLDDWNNRQECVSLSLNSHHFQHFAIQGNELISL
ncbi:class A beta-lactamase-related serine hydrolase [Anaerobacillus alkaliphilus]|uniref:Class A beta-lactamase-related serine hydrolase n=2 Tax=Anaerobacillus alkaliphilus TaxID=1548597 RepID=A0A4Q0W188_9BACI|nr:class A beta-lactamase-related serine hydrolase [Anaerobacillus alkaliphilus]